MKNAPKQHNMSVLLKYSKYIEYLRIHLFKHDFFGFKPMDLGDKI